jgi:hypothetical protein
VPFDRDNALKKARNLLGTRPGSPRLWARSSPEEPSLQPAAGDPAARALFELSAAAIDLSGILDGGCASALTGRVARDSEAPEIDLTEVPQELKPRPPGQGGRD